jgi:2-dehydropantoate 2-reductase
MKHAILGAGAIGGLIATTLASLGEEVTVLVRTESLSTYPKSLTLERPASSTPGALSAAVKTATTLTEAVEVLWIATKTYQLQAAIEAVQTSPTCVVPLLNGVDHIQILRARFGHDAVIPATIAVEAERVAAGRFIQRSPFVRLNLGGRAEPLLGPLIAQLGNLGFTCQFIPNESTLLWSKLCFLGPFALVTSASGMNIGEVFADAQWKQKLSSAIAEACAVANASGAEIDVVQLQKVFDGAPPGMRSSMQKDLAAGRQLELDAIGGPIVRGGEQHGIDISTTAGLITAIRAKIGAR